MAPPREPTVADLQANLVMCQNEVARLRAKLEAKNSLAKQLREINKHLTAKVRDLEARIKELQGHG